MLTSLRWCTFFLSLGCAHTPRSTGLEGLKPVAEKFHQSIRWKSYREAAEMIVPERREAFLRARQRQKDERDLSITDYDMQEAKISADGMHAHLVTHLSWMRLPSASEHTQNVTTEFVSRNGVWLVEHQDAGPFIPEMSEPVTPPLPSGP